MSEPAWDQSKFDALLKVHLKNTSRTVTEVLNGHAYHIARKAVWYTHKADKQSIQNSLGKFVSSKRTMSTRIVRLTQARDQEAPLAALIINKRRGAKGEPGLYGAAMSRAIVAMIGARLRSIAFLKSGWIPAIRILEGMVKDKAHAAPRDRDAQVRGMEKGSAIPAVEGANPVAKIINSALALGDKSGGALAKWGGDGLNAAFYDETQSLKEHLQEKLGPIFEETNAQL